MTLPATRERIERIAKEHGFKMWQVTTWANLNDCEQRFIAALTTFAEESKWLPISSAPKDGTEILVPKTGIGFVDSSTHWQPLPEPPIEKDEV